MSVSGKQQQASKAICNIVLVIGVSYGMKGTVIDVLNNAMKNLLPELSDVSEAVQDISIKLSVLSFSDEARWMFDAPIDASTFHWANLYAGGGSCFGSACAELDDKLSCSGFFSGESEYLAPIIALFMKDNPTDDFADAFESLKKNKLFQQAIKTAVAIGNRIDCDLLAEFTGDPSKVSHRFDSNSFMRFVQFAELKERQEEDVGKSESIFDDEAW